MTNTIPTMAAAALTAAFRDPVAAPHLARPFTTLASHAIDAAREAETAAAMQAWREWTEPPAYRCILADPPWSYRNGGNGAAKNHYPTMTTADLKAMPVSQLAAPDCVLLLWATWPQLPDALALIEAWGFTYVTGLPWVKLSPASTIGSAGESAPRPAYGTGVWVRGCSEAVLIAKRGNARPATGNYLGLLSNRLQHSRKPDSIYELAEGLVPLAQEPEPISHLEMFARRRRPRWDVFGHIEGSITLPQGKENDDHDA